MSSFAAALRLWKANLRVSPQGSLLQVSVPQPRTQSVRRTDDDVRFGSKADIPLIPSNVRFTPRSGHRNSVEECPLCAKSGHMQCNKSIEVCTDEFSAAIGAG